MRKLFLFLLLTVFLPPAVRPAEAETFNAGQMIMEHIADAHEWHIMSIGHVHVSIPLPVILWHEGRLHIFSFAAFHHGENTYKGFKYMTEGPLKGKIVYLGLGEDRQPVLPLDLSLTKNVLAIFISVILILFIFFSVASYYQKHPDAPPRGLAAFLEPLILFVRDDIAKSSIGVKNYEKYTPYLLTVFFFIFFNNLLGLIPFFPGGANVTGNIAVTMVLALFTFLITTLSGNKDYWRHIFNAPGVPWWLKIPVPLMPLVELMGVFTKPFVLMVRLFANITAGHIIVLGFISLIFIFGNIHPALGIGISWISIIMSVFLSLLEILVAFLQAFVFTLLSALYFGMATEEHSSDHNNHP